VLACVTHLTDAISPKKCDRKKEVTIKQIIPEPHQKEMESQSFSNSISPLHPAPHSHPEHETNHIHSDASLRQIINRLSRIEGHVRGIKTMVTESRPCPEVLIQVAAVRGAIDRVARLILDEHLSECITRAAKEGNIESEIEELKSALDRFL
jgi:DNA-binding FrmR family transcriptional regulator